MHFEAACILECFSAECIYIDQADCVLYDMSDSSPNVLLQSSSSQRNRLSLTQSRKTIIAQKLFDCMHRSAESHKSFICQHDLDRIWEAPKNIKKLLGHETWTEAEIATVQEKFTKILSIIILINSSDCIRRFRSLFFDTIGSPNARTDDEIPFAMEQLSFLDISSGKLFYEKQFVVKPEYVKNTRKQENQVIPANHRLPFVYEKSGIGWGGYGTVDEVGIAPGYLKQETGTNWPNVRTPNRVNIICTDQNGIQVRAVACKKIETNETEVDYRKEVSNLQILKESLTSHNRIMLHLATIIHGPSFNILLPLALHGDLELFLNGGISYARFETGEEVYDPGIRFPNLNPENLPRALIDECALLADGLRWLHDELRVPAEADLYCAHMDLKPSNVLVDDDPDSPVGRWMLSDFGISVFKASTGRQESGVLSIGDVHAELTLKTRAKRGHGPYQAPEVQPGGKKNVGRRSDVWSLGCIFSEILAFALSTMEELRHFRAERKRYNSNDYFYSPRAPSGHLRVPSAPIEYELRPAVQSWLTTLHTRFFQPRRWVECCVGVIERILIVNPSKRPTAKLTWKLLRHVAAHLHPLPTDAALDCPILNSNLSPLNSPGQRLGNHQIPAVAVSPAANDDMVSSAEFESAQAESKDKYGKGKELESRGLSDGQQQEKSMEKEMSMDSSRQHTKINDSRPTTPVSNSTPRPSRPPPPISTPRPLVEAPEQSYPRNRRGEHKSIEHRGSWGQQGSTSSEGTDKALLATGTVKLPIPGGAILNIAVSSSGDTVAYLFSDCIYAYVMDVVNECHGAVMYLPLAKDKGWQCLTLAGPYVVAWGWSSSNSKRLVRCTKHIHGSSLTTFRYTWQTEIRLLMKYPSQTMFQTSIFPPWLCQNKVPSHLFVIKS